MKGNPDNSFKAPFSRRLDIFRLLLCCGLLILLTQGIAYSGQHEHGQHLKKNEQNHSQHMKKMQDVGQDSTSVNLKVPDLELINQNGETGRFLSDFIGDKQVALTFVFTSCTTICPVIDGIFLNLQNKLADRLGKDVALLTLTVDAARDIPERLKMHTDKIGAKPGWNYLTGELETVREILKALEVYTPDINNHPPVVFVVDGVKNNWQRLNGFPSAAEIEKMM